MKIVFIKVNMMYSKGKDALKPLIFPIIEKLTPPGHELVFFDERIENLPETMDADIIALSVETFAAGRAYELSDKYKHDGNLIVMGGFHPTALPEEALEHADIIIRGDAEDSWEEMVNNLTELFSDKDIQAPIREHLTKRIYLSENKCRMSYVDNNAECFKGKKYLPLAMVQASRGCKFNCDFCSIKSLYPGQVRQKDIEDIVREIRESREKLLFFIDDNLFLNENSAKELFRAIKPLKKKWACQISLEIAFKDELLDMMYDSGCFMVLIGFESLNEQNLEIMNKSANLRIMHESGPEAAIANIYRHKIMIYGMFVLGYDYDTPKSITETYEFAVRNNLAVANFNPLMILPGTALYDRMTKEGRMRFEKWWLDPEYRYGDAMYFPKSMLPEDLEKGCKNARFEFNTYRNIFKRMFGAKVNHRTPLNAMVFFAVNYISRVEIHRKQGESL